MALRAGGRLRAAGLARGAFGRRWAGAGASAWRMAARKAVSTCAAPVTTSTQRRVSFENKECTAVSFGPGRCPKWGGTPGMPRLRDAAMKV